MTSNWTTNMADTGTLTTWGTTKVDVFAGTIPQGLFSKHRQQQRNSVASAPNERKGV